MKVIAECSSIADVKQRRQEEGKEAKHGWKEGDWEKGTIPSHIFSFPTPSPFMPASYMHQVAENYVIKNLTLLAESLRPRKDTMPLLQFI